MKPTRSPACSRLHGRMRPGGAAACRVVFAIAAFGVLSACEQNSFVPPPPPKVEVALPVQRVDHALSGGDRQHRADQERRSRRARAGLSAIDQLPGRHFREGRHHAVHDRARYLQAEARAGAGGRSRHAGVDEAGRSRFQAAVGSGAKAGRLAGDARYFDVQRAKTRRPICSRPRSTPRSRRSITAIPMSPRRSTASSARIWSRSANWSACRRRRSLPPSWRSTRSM